MSFNDVVVLGAGPSGLTAAYCLARAGALVTVVDRAGVVGGLMRGVRCGDFYFDIGRKKLHTEFPEIDALWTELLGVEYRYYPNLVGVLFGDRILDSTGERQGPMRGMSLRQAARLGASYLWSQLRPGSRRPTNLEDYCLLMYGQGVYDYFIHGFRKKFTGKSFSQMPPPEGIDVIPRFAYLRNRSAKSMGTTPSAPQRKENLRHPVRGTGQIIDRIEAGARAAGAKFLMDAEVMALNVEGGIVRSVVVRHRGRELELPAGSVVTSLPVPLLLKLLRPHPPEELRSPPPGEVAFKKSTALVYLMADGEPRFPHSWLNVNDLTYRVGRVVNYATWNCEMVPPGKTGLCLEYFCVEGDGLMDLSEEGLGALALDEAERAGLIDRSKVFDTLVLRLPHANAATNTKDLESEWFCRTTDYLRGISGLYETNRPGMDRASLAGMDAAEAWRTGRPMSGRSLETIRPPRTAR